MDNLLPILAIITFAAIALRIFRSFKKRDHLSDEDLMSPRYFMPRSPEYNRIISHLSTCNKCAERMEFLHAEQANLGDSKKI